MLCGIKSLVTVRNIVCSQIKYLQERKISSEAQTGTDRWKATVAAWQREESGRNWSDRGTRCTPSWELHPHVTPTVPRRQPNFAETTEKAARDKRQTEEVSSFGTQLINCAAGGAGSSLTALTPNQCSRLADWLAGWLLCCITAYVRAYALHMGTAAFLLELCFLQQVLSVICLKGAKLFFSFLFCFFSLVKGIKH